MANYDDLNTKQIFFVGIGSVAVTVVTILAAQYIYYLLLDNHQKILRAESSYHRQNAILVDQIEEVSRYGADPLTGNVTIPIADAMKLVAKESEAASKTDAENADDKDAT